MDIISSISQSLSEIHFIGQFVGWIHGLVNDYGLTVILFTLVLKLITLPLDYWSRLSMKKTSAAQKELKPYIEDIDKRYPDDPQKANIEKQALYKKYNIKVASGCLPMIVTMVIFIFMFQGLSAYSSYSSNMLYNKLAASYNSVYNEKYAYEQRVADKEVIDALNAQISELEKLGENISEEQKAILDGYKSDLSGKISERSVKEKSAGEAAANAAAATFDSEREGFLWVKNIYRPDTWAQVFATYDEAAGTGANGQGIDKNKVSKEDYNLIYDAVMLSDAGKGYTGNHWNGLIILPVLSIGLAFVSSLISQKANKVKGGVEDPQMEKSNKMMMFMMPLIYAFFVFQYTAAFSVYMVFSALFSILAGLIINPITDKKAEAAIRAQFDSNKPSYMRKK